MEDQSPNQSKIAHKCELCDMFLIVDDGDFMDNFICSKCDKIIELQEKLIELHTKLSRVTEFNTTLKKGRKSRKLLTPRF